MVVAHRRLAEVLSNITKSQSGGYLEICTIINEGRWKYSLETNIMESQISERNNALRVIYLRTESPSEIVTLAERSLELELRITRDETF